MEKLKFVNKINVQLWIPVLIFILLFSVSRFYGLEEHPDYWGTVYSIIYPQHFTIGLDSSDYALPHVAILYTFLVKFFGGHLWLDDRFCLFVYFLFALAAFIGIVRIILLWVGRDVFAVLTVLGITTAFHQFISNSPQILDQGSFRPSAFVHPFCIWMVYFILRKSWGKAALMIVLANAMFVREAWFPALAGFCFILKDRYHLRWSIIALVIAIVFLIFLGGNYWYQMIHGRVWENAKLFDKALYTYETGESDPFMDGIGPVIYLLLIILCCRIRFPDLSVTTFIRRFSCLSGIVYILGAIYLTYAPDALKVLFFLALDVTRSTWLPQIMMFIFLSCFLVRKIDFTSLKKSFWPWVGLMVLYVFPVFALHAWKYFFQSKLMEGQPFIHPEVFNKCIVLILLISVLAVIYFIREKRGFKKGNVVMVVFIPIILLSFASHLNKLHQRWPALKFLFHYGVVGDSPSAPWARINEYIRQSTLPTSAVMAFTHNRKGGIELDQSLRVRTGRLSGVPIPFSSLRSYFDYKEKQRLDALSSYIVNFSLALSNCDAIGINRTVKLVPLPDYMIVPVDYHCDLKGVLGYSKIKEIDAFVILKKIASHTYDKFK